MKKNIEIDVKNPENHTTYNKECKKYHQVKPLGMFSLCKLTVDGHEGQCKACKYSRQKVINALKKQKKVPETNIIENKLPVQADKTTKPIVSGKKIDMPIARMDPGHLLLSLDFKSHTEIYEAILQISEIEFRTPEMQVMFWLKKTLVENGYAQYHDKKYLYE